MTPSEASVPFPYKICQKGIHQYPRSVKKCPECIAASNLKSYLKNKEQIIARAKQKELDDPDWAESRRRYKKEYWAKHGEAIRENKRRRYREDKDWRERKKREASDWAEKNRERVVWGAMIRRCYNPTVNGYEDYGGRGISVCERWKGENGLENFLTDMGRRPSAMHSIERIDNDGNYEPGNCCWKNRSQQSRNRRSNVVLTYNGESRCLTEWGEVVGIAPMRIRDRIVKLGWSIEKALTTPIRPMEFPMSKWKQRELFPVEK